VSVYKSVTVFIVVTYQCLLLAFVSFNIAYAWHIFWVTTAGQKEKLGCKIIFSVLFCSISARSFYIYFYVAF